MQAKIVKRNNMGKINGWDKDGDMCNICDKKESLTLCEGCNKLACEEHFTEALCNTCMAKVKAMPKVGYCSTSISESVSWIEKEWNKSMLNKELVNGMIQTAQMMVTYNNALIENGMSKEDALKITIAYQGQQIEAVTKASIEEKKNIMLLAKTTANN